MLPPSWRLDRARNGSGTADNRRCPRSPAAPCRWPLGQARNAGCVGSEGSKSSFHAGRLSRTTRQATARFRAARDIGRRRRLARQMPASTWPAAVDLYGAATRVRLRTAQPARRATAQRFPARPFQTSSCDSWRPFLRPAVIFGGVSAGSETATNTTPDVARRARRTVRWPRAAGPGTSAPSLRHAYLELLKLSLCDLAATTPVSGGRPESGDSASRELECEQLRL